jgi:serine/threonine protein kinase
MYIEDLGPEWHKLGRLGGGAHGSVFLYRYNPTNLQYAVKFIERGDTITEQTVREVANHSQLIHPNIIRFKEVILTRSKLAVVMEHCAGGDVFRYGCTGL